MSREISLDRLRLFVAVAECEGFTAAARRLGSTKKLVSHHIARLEAELGGALFHRTTRQVRLTAAGRELLRVCQPALGELTNAVSHFSKSASQPSGRLRITATPEYASGVLGHIVAEFAVLYPDLNVELHTSIDRLDLIEADIDLAVRVGWLDDSSLRARRIARFEQFIVAAPEYLLRNGAPTHPNQLRAHRWVELTLLPTPLRWKLTSESGAELQVQLQAFVRGNSPPAVLGLVRGGAGITALPDFIVSADLESGRLVRLLSKWTLPEGGYYFVFPANDKSSANVRAFIDFFRARMNRLQRHVIGT